jgi:hypothetical protein
VRLLVGTTDAVVAGTLGNGRRGRQALRVVDLEIALDRSVQLLGETDRRGEGIDQAILSLLRDLGLESPLPLEPGLPLRGSVESLGLAGGGPDLGWRLGRLVEAEETVDGGLYLGLGGNDIAIFTLGGRESDLDHLRIT